MQSIINYLALAQNHWLAEAANLAESRTVGTLCAFAAATYRSSHRSSLSLYSLIIYLIIGLFFCFPSLSLRHDDPSPQKHKCKQRKCNYWFNPRWRMSIRSEVPCEGVICSDDPPLQPFPLQEAREVHRLLVGGKWNPTQIITNYSVGRGGSEKRELMIT